MAYHHGNLRQALVQAGLDILAEEGISALTLRGCAARVGVSHSAPKNHFHNLDRLIAAIGAEGHRRLSVAMLGKMADAEPSPRAQLVAAAKGYLAFALDHPDLFRLMFSLPRAEVFDAERRGAADESYAILRRVCAPIVPRINGVPVAPAVVETMVWSYVHGYASLAVNNRLRRPEEAMGRLPGIEEAMPEFEIGDATVIGDASARGPTG